MKDYILDHNFGSYENDKSINKLTLRTPEELNKYLHHSLPDILQAEIHNGFIIKYEDGSIYALILEEKN